MSRTGRFVKRSIWLWPLIAIGLLSSVGYLIHSSIRTTMRESLASELQTLLNVEVAMLENWLQAQQSNTESVSNDSDVRRIARELSAVAQVAKQGLADAGNRTGESNADLSRPNSSDDQTLAADTPRVMRSQLARLVAPALSTHGYSGFVLTDRDETVLAASEPSLVGSAAPTPLIAAISKALDGKPTVTKPFRSVAALKDNAGQVRTGVPTMFAVAPVRDDDFHPVAALAFRIRPEREFTRILQLGRIGDSGETYAFDSHGTLLSNSRFDDNLVLLGLIPDQEGSQSLLHLLVRDPQGNMRKGFRPTKRRGDLPLTRMAQSAAAGTADTDVDGYRDYRGVPVVGAWTWLNDYDFGVTTESDVDEAYHPLMILQRAFWSLMILLALCSLALFGFMLFVARLQRQAREAAIETKRLGQYTLGEKLGQGAMGVVYKGRHAMLRRPTAIKLLSTGRVTERSIQRFEREVQITSRLNHPNTIAIYDFGHTPEGVFYYAMEYLDGIDLRDLVYEHGPQPPARVIHILKQVCGSLYEAHLSGLVHRDIKPANVMLSQRGGESDVVKVLDFGLVKAFDDGDAEDAGIAGTPLYLSPEAILTPGAVSACSDLYAVGAVGYFLLTGRPVFSGGTLKELCQSHLADIPVPPSQIDGIEVAEDLECLILSCLEKTRGKRPQTARELMLSLQGCADNDGWGIEDADRWWSRRDRGLLPVTNSGSALGQQRTPKGGVTETIVLPSAIRQSESVDSEHSEDDTSADN